MVEDIVVKQKSQLSFFDVATHTSFKTPADEKSMVVTASFKSQDLMILNINMARTTYSYRSTCYATMQTCKYCETVSQ